MGNRAHSVAGTPTNWYSGQHPLRTSRGFSLDVLTVTIHGDSTKILGESYGCDATGKEETFDVIYGLAYPTNT